MPKITGKFCKKCSICGRVPVIGKGLCNRHYLKVYRGKSKIKALTRTEITLEFLALCIKSNTDKCLERLDSKHKPQGYYPSFKYEGIYYKLGWWVLEKTVGKRPKSLEMRHHCGNSKCCNPRHLSWSTHLENIGDQVLHGTNYDKHGENNPNAKLTIDQVRYIRKHYIKGRGWYDPGNAQILAKELGVAAHLIRSAARGGWKNA